MYSLQSSVILHIPARIQDNPMQQSIAHITVVVNNYDDAIAFYTEKLNFDLVEDTPLSDSKRWVLIAPKGSTGTKLLLAQASNEQQRLAVGNQTGGRVGFFLQTDNFDRDFAQMKANGVNFIREPTVQEYGKVAVFEDLYTNQWDLIEYYV